MLWIVLDVDDTRLFVSHKRAITYALERGFDENFPEEIEIEDEDEDSDDSDNDI